VPLGCTLCVPRYSRLVLLHGVTPHPDPVTVELLPPLAAPVPSIVEACPDSTEDNVTSPEIRLHITINVVSRLNAAEEARSLLVEELSLHEFHPDQILFLQESLLSLHKFLLDQILFLQESLESWLVPHFIEEFLGHEMVAAPLLDMDVPYPPDVWGKVALGHSMAISASGRSSVGTLVVVEGSTEVQVLLSPPQEPVARLYSAQVIMTQCISYVTCHGKVDNSLARPPELADLELGPMVPSHWHAQLATKGRGGAISSRLLVPHHPLPIKKVPR
jgi:hypothetical protein